MSATLQECNNYVKEVGVAWVRERVPRTGYRVSTRYMVALVRALARALALVWSHVQNAGLRECAN